MVILFYYSACVVVVDSNPYSYNKLHMSTYMFMILRKDVKVDVSVIGLLDQFSRRET